jgi:hypothetical protein
MSTQESKQVFQSLHPCAPETTLWQVQVCVCVYVQFAKM